jgi:hypothetical protein
VEKNDKEMGVWIVLYCTEGVCPNDGLLTAGAMPRLRCAVGSGHTTRRLKEVAAVRRGEERREWNGRDGVHIYSHNQSTTLIPW